MHSRYKFYIRCIAFSTYLCFCYSVFAQSDASSLTPLEYAETLSNQNRKPEAIKFLMENIAAGNVTGQQKFEAYNHIVNDHTFLGNLGEATSINAQMRQEAQRTDNILYIGQSYINDGELRQKQGKFEDALLLQMEALTLYKQADNTRYIAHALLEMSYSLIKLNRNIEALDYATQSQKLGEEIENLETIASAHNSIGMIQENLGNLTLALESHQKTIALDRLRGDTDELPTSYFNVANIFKKMGDYEQARFFTNEALQLDIPGKNPEHIGYDYAMLAELSAKLNEHKTARQQAEQALTYFQSTDSQGHISWVYNIFARLALASGDLEQAQAYVQQALDLNQNINYQQQLIQSQLIQLEIKLAQSQYQEVLARIETLLPQSIKHQNYAQIRSLIALKTKSFEQLGNYAAALQTYKDYNQLRDSVEAENRATILAQLQNQMDYLHKEHRIAILESQGKVKELLIAQEKLEKNLWIIVLFLICLLIGIIGYRERTKRRLAAFEKELLAESIHRKNTMLAEVAHELRSPLTALHLQVESLQYNLEVDPEAAYLRLNNKVTEINQLIEDLYDLARADNGLLRLNFQQVKVHKLVDEIIEGYGEVLLQKGLQLTTQMQIPPQDTFTVDAHRIKQVIVNLLRNSMNYTDSPGLIGCKVTRQDEMVEILLEDSEPGVTADEIPRLFERMYRADGSTEKDTDGSGLGLSICKSLIEAHQGQITAQASDLGGLKIRILLPATEENDRIVAAA